MVLSCQPFYFIMPSFDVVVGPWPVLAPLGDMVVAVEPCRFKVVGELGNPIVSWIARYVQS